MDEQLNKVATFNKEYGAGTTNLVQKGQLVGSSVDTFNNAPGGTSLNAMLGVPRVIYASRTHSQLSQGVCIIIPFFIGKNLEKIEKNLNINFSYARIETHWI